MPKLSELTDYDAVGNYTGGTSVVDTPIVSPPPSNSKIDKILNSLFRDDDQRYQLWPEKIIREGLTAAGDTMSGKVPQWSVDNETGDVHTSPQMIEKAQAISALAGTGGLGGVTDATLGATPFLRPALKYKDRLYKGKEGQGHQDVIPDALYPEFQKMAMSGEDISHYNFGFVNDKGHFLNREDALKYGIDTGLIDPQAGKFGALTSTLMADSSKPGTAIEAMAKAEPFYSALEHNVSKISQDKMNGEQWLGTLSNKPGVKPEELDWTGLKNYLEENKGKSVTNEQIQEHLTNNKVELKEVNKGGSGKDRLNNLSEEKLNDLIYSYADKSERNPSQVMKSFKSGDEELAAALEDHLDKNFNNKFDTSNDTKYHSYQLPGATNYREMLLTLPQKVKDDVVPSPTASAKYLKDWEALVVEDKRLRPLVDDYNRRLSGSEWDKAKADLQVNNAKMDSLHNQMVEDTMKENPGKYGNPYKSSHWDEPNILAHVRMNDRTIDGKKSLHMEEIQSDWHQQGREVGYNQGKTKDWKITGNDKDGYEIKSEGVPIWEGTTRQAADRQLADIQSRNVALDKGVPDAPFKKSWHELALKRMIREAAEKGYDRLSWTPGEAQAARYDLSKHIDALSWNPETEQLKGFKGKDNVLNKKATAEQLPDVIGKETAARLLKSDTQPVGLKGTPHHILEGQDLKIGGEGMKGFYDQIIPKALEKLGKEHGVKVKTFIEPDTYKKTLTGYGPTIKGNTIHYIDIPQSLRDAAMNKGFPLFSSTHMFTPVNHEPEFKKK